MSWLTVAREALELAKGIASADLQRKLIEMQMEGNAMHGELLECRQEVARLQAALESKVHLEMDGDVYWADGDPSPF